MAQGRGRTGGGAPRRRNDAEAEEWRPRSTLRMERKEQYLGAVVASIFALMGLLYLTVKPPHGHPQPKAVVPVIVLVGAGIVALSLLLANRILSGILATLTGFAASGPANVGHSVIWLRKVGFFLGILYAVYLTVQQSHTQRMNRFAENPPKRDDDGPS